ncbi:cell division protein FtsW [Chlorobium phaeovibrioides]|uniref:Probable peptidoglycan glycosyltransferase FtsW n=1 Tax=Chlorobium phaeovibrioides TaxID=1094 RepID=A0A3S0NAJ8_CHLPH|nr:putative peptidoglycan glycosyltransferase FtsW [Chlorobium phaeovibrioides]KAA6233285.1 cell division protein FtsW [Chlorobium phaeovibrioides]MWV54493.1 cell division protein FtsW [Chlorobium phaeovibrioides]QEQ57726.1 cell division protein FtsW [Chlorobium phaeovibrioides]RTY36786.1 cell division protein FtsW [Chlorobium phaeovibrioides]RTY38197.1 cell division protein FtsW [Chlorobium phaeovibrioides]
MESVETSRAGAIAGKMLLLIVAVLMCIGVVVVYSSGAGWAETKFSNREYFLYRHLVFTVAGIGVVLGVARIDYHLFRKISRLFLMAAIGILLLLLMLKVVGVIHGAARWIGFGPVKFQASDLAKYALIFHLARLLEEKQSYIKEWTSSFLPMLLLLLTVVVLVALEPNFSTASLIGIIGLTLMFIGGVSLRHLGVTLLSMLPIAAAYAMSAPYRMARLTAFFTSDEKKLSYQVVQALIGLGNGGLRGLGMGESKQRELYLPLSYNDFVFVVIGEEYGFIGAVVVLLLFTALLVCGIIIAKNAPDAFGRYVAAGISVAITLFAFINIAVACHLIPTTGVALPFISYGGTALLANSLGIGILVSISSHRKRMMKRGAREPENIMEERER